MSNEINIFLIILNTMITITTLTELPEVRQVDVDKLENPQNNKLFLHDVNRFRRWLDASDMRYMNWSTILEKQSFRDASLILKYFECGENWTCSNETQCDPYVHFLLGQPGFYHISSNDKEFNDAIPRLFQFLGQTVDTESAACGKRNQFYWYNKSECRDHAYKIYRNTFQFGCAQIECKIKQKETFHLACKFDASTVIRPSSLGFTLLFSPASELNGHCSLCPKQASSCHNGLCISGSVSTVNCSCGYNLLWMFWYFVLLCLN